MQDISATIASLQQTITSISNAAQVSREKLRIATKNAHDLLLIAKQKADATENAQLAAFLASMAHMVEQLDQVAQSDYPEQNANLSKPQQILAQIINTYQETIVPQLSRISNFAKDNQEKIQQINDITRLGSDVVDCCTQVYQLSEHMDTTEKIYAMLGMVLMFAGIGMLIALTVNPATGIPVVAALTVVALGCALCRKSVARHKERPEAAPINASLDRQRDLLEEIADKNPEAKAYPRQILRFGSAPAAKPAPLTTPKQPEITPEPDKKQSLIDKLKAQFDKMIGGDGN